MAANPHAAAKPATAVKTVKLLVNGQFVESKAKAWRDVVNPATQEVLARVPMCEANEVDAAVKSAAAAFKTWRNVPIAARARVMLKLQELIRRDMKKLAAVLTAAAPWLAPHALSELRALPSVQELHGASLMASRIAVDLDQRDARRQVRSRGVVDVQPDAPD